MKPPKVEGLVTLRDQIAEFHCIIKCGLCLIKLHCADFFPPPSLPFRCKCVLCCISPDLLGLCEGDGGGCHSMVSLDILCLSLMHLARTSAKAPRPNLIYC